MAGGRQFCFRMELERQRILDSMGIVTTFSMRYSN